MGIQDLAFATGTYRVDLATIAPRLDTDPAKYYRGLGQQEMSVVAEDEDIVTLGARAAARIAERGGLDGVRTLLLATETGIDQAKAAGVYVHRLLGLPANVRVVELKQACYSATAAAQFAAALVTRDPRERVLVVATDIARYDLDTAAEPTQGAGAVAFTVGAEPGLLELEPIAGLYTADVMDFWRPNHRVTAIVDGKTSITAYLDAVAGAYTDYRSRGGAAFDDLSYIVYHQPFTKMAVKAHRHLAQVAGSVASTADLAAQVEPTTAYNRRIGNSYTASAYLGLLALLDGQADLSGTRLGIASYGSGAVAEFLSARVVPGYAGLLRREENLALLEGRIEVDDEAYLRLQRAATRPDPSNYTTREQTSGPFRFAGVTDDRRIYEAAGR